MWTVELQTSLSRCLPQRHSEPGQAFLHRPAINSHPPEELHWGGDRVRKRARQKKRLGGRLITVYAHLGPFTYVLPPRRLAVSGHLPRSTVYSRPRSISLSARPSYSTLAKLCLHVYLIVISLLWNNYAVGFVLPEGSICFPLRIQLAPYSAAVLNCSPRSQCFVPIHIALNWGLIWCRSAFIQQWYCPIITPPVILNDTAVASLCNIALISVRECCGVALCIVVQAADKTLAPTSLCYS